MSCHRIFILASKHGTLGFEKPTYFPTNWAFLFSRNAAIPSFWSRVPKSMEKAVNSVLRPSLRPVLSPVLIAVLHALMAMGGILARRLASFSASEQELLLRVDPRNQPEGQRFVRLDRRPQEKHLRRRSKADQARQTLRTAAAGDDSQSDFREPQNGIFRSQAKVAAKGYLKAATESKT